MERKQKAPARRADKGGKAAFLGALMSPEISILIPLIILCAYTGINKPAFFAVKNLQIIVRYCAFIGALTLGQAFVLMTGEIDLSIGTNSMLCSIVFTTLAVTFGWDPSVSIVLAILVGALVGYANSAFAFRLGMPFLWIPVLARTFASRTSAAHR